jgi:hypothetical protein
MIADKPMAARTRHFFVLLFSAVILLPLSAHGKATPAPAAISFLNNSKTDTVDGVLFTAMTDKKAYNSGDTLLVSYLISNHSMGSVLYDFKTSCQFILEVIQSNGNSVVSQASTGLKYLHKQDCAPIMSSLKLAPLAEKNVTFAAVPLTLKNTDTLTVKAQMSGYPLSAVLMRVVYKAFSAPSGPVALEWSAENKPGLEFNGETKMLIIHVTRAQRLTISAFILTGQKINKLSCERFLAPGTHKISFNNPKLAEGIVIFKVEGNGFSETKTINLSR